MRSILFVILFMTMIFGVAIIGVYTSQYNAGVIPVEECARYLGHSFCDFFYDSVKGAFTSSD
jgi:hypothetical protein